MQHLIISFFGALNNREISLLIWMTLIIISVFLIKKVRSALPNLVASFFAWKLSVVYVCLLTYIIVIILFLHHFHIWDRTLLKDTVFWIFGAAFIICFNSIKAKNNKYFKNILIDSIKLTVLLEFIINLYSFSLIVEFFLFPILTLLVLLRTVADADEKHKLASKVFKRLINGLGLIIFIYAIYKTVSMYQVSFSVSNLKSLLLAPILTLMFIPYAYTFSMVTNYETLFIRIKLLTRDDTSFKLVKREIIKVANIDIKKLNNIATKINMFDLENQASLTKYIKDISK